MSELSNIINVTITRQTQAIARANFGIIMLVDEFDPGGSPPFAGRSKEYASLGELTTDGYTTGTYVYDSANKIFAQSPTVDKIKVGAKFITTTPDADWTAALNAIQTADQDWYGFTIKSDTVSDVEETADWTETQKKIFFIRTDDAVVITSGTTDIASYIESNNYDRSVVYYDPSTNSDYIDAAAPGEAFPYDPGSQTWAFKTFSGVTSYTLTSAERTFALNKNANIFTPTAGVDITEFGTVGSGEYIDIIRGVDWLESRIQEIIFSELINVRKIPYTDEGVSLVEGLLKEALDEAVQAGLITTDYITTVPRVADIDDQDKIARLLPNIEFSATLQGAIHKVEINGVVSV